MRKTQQAPGALERVREFINTRDLEAQTDALAGTRDLVAWFAEREMLAPAARATERDLDNALALRESLRELALAHNDGRQPRAEAGHTLDVAARRARLELRFDAAGSPRLQAEANGVDAALGALLAIVNDAIAQGTWARLKACRLHDCEWAFYDHTKNRSGAWCNMDVCGNRAKARAYRARRGTPA